MTFLMRCSRVCRHSPSFSRSLAPHTCSLLRHVSTRRPISTTQASPAQPATATSTSFMDRFAPSFAPSSLEQPLFFPDEPQAPIIRTEVPGPKGREAIKHLDTVFDTRSLNMMANYPESIGNYIADLDGNLLLDVYAQIASIPVGYNNSALIAAASSPDMVNAMVNRPAMGNFPAHDWASILETGLLKAAPRGCTQVFTATAGSDANELAYKAAFIWKRRMQRSAANNGADGGTVDFTAEEMSSSLNNAAPGSPDMSILSFATGFHGRLFGSLSTTRSKPIHKLDIPAFNWPSAPFPMLKYPLDQHEEANKAEEQRCLTEVEKQITTFPSPVAALVVEPIQSEGGDNHAFPSFFRSLREITRKHDVLLIVDEVQTGVGATGKFWAHDHWNLTDPPDMVTFSKKAQAAGYYFGREDLRPAQAYRQFNTWMGDPCRALLFRAIHDEIVSKDLVENTRVVGEYLFGGLTALAERFPDEIVGLRGRGSGTFIAWDSPRRDEFLKRMKGAGVNIGGSGVRAVRLRPMLCFQRQHADILLEACEKVFSSEGHGAQLGALKRDDIDA